MKQSEQIVKRLFPPGETAFYPSKRLNNSAQAMPRFGVLIPAYEPDSRLTDLAVQLTECGITVVVVNDGSTTGLEVFQELERIPITVLHHPQNQGKGRALKTGLAWMAERGFRAAVTADADGQHTAEDIRRIAEELVRRPDQLILGMRDLSQMPPKSKTGNSVTRRLFQVLYGINLCDTQTGLRGIPLTKDSMPGLLELRGERYEYEMAMLVHADRLFPRGTLEVPIQTVYLNENKSSHFRPFQDGAKIYSVLFQNLPRFFCTSLLAFLMDELLFNLLYYLLYLGTVLSTVLARIVSGSANFMLNKHFVFRDKNGKTYTVWNYLKLAVGILLVNVILMRLLVDVLGMPAFAMKILVECVLYAVSFTVQNQLASRS